MLLFWLHSHFAPHTSKLRTHRGKPIPAMNQKVLSSSFDDKPPGADEEDALKVRDLEANITPESEGDGSEVKDHRVKGVHKSGRTVHKLAEKEMAEVNAAINKMHLRFGMATAQLGHMGSRERGREIDELD